MPELKFIDFDQMLTASTAIANESYDTPMEDVKVHIVSEDNILYKIEDVKFNPVTGSILISFDHDNTTEVLDEDES